MQEQHLEREGPELCKEDSVKCREDIVEEWRQMEDTFRKL